MSDNPGGFDEPTSGGVTSQTAYVYDDNDVAVSSVAAVWEDGEWKLYDSTMQPYTLPADHYLVWKTEGVALTPPDPTIRCYNREVPVSEPTSKPNNVANKGYVEQTLWTISQFENAGNVGSTDAGFHALVTLDEDGVPTVNGEYVQSNVTTVNRNEGSAYGELVRYEGYLYNPIRYPDTTAGKYVTKAELVDSYTGTTQADYSQLFVASKTGNYTLSRGDLGLVDDNPAPGDAIYTLDPAQRGEWMRFAYVNGDQGGASQFNIQMRLTYADGSVQTLALTNFIHQVGVLAYHAETTMEPLVFDTVAGTWTKDGNPETVDTSLGNLKETTCGQLPITFDVWNEAGTASFSSLFGGSQTGYEYSIDGGKTFQSSPVFDLSESGAVEVVPVVRDSNGTLSAKQGLSTHFPCVEKTWSVDLISAAVNDVLYDDGVGNRGWSLVYGAEVYVDNFSSNNTDGRWSVTGDIDITGNGYMYFNNGTNSTGNASATKLLQESYAVGAVGAVDYDRYFYYYGDNSPASDIDVKFQIVDTTTNTVLAENRDQFSGQWLSNATNVQLRFVGTGNPLAFRVLDESVDPVGAVDSTGHYLRIDNYAEYVGEFVDNTHYAKKGGNHHLFFRGISGQATYQSDAHGYDKDVTIVPKFDIRRYGTLDTTAGDVDKVTLQYQINGGAWVTMLEHEGQFDAANEIYLSPFYYEKGIDLAAGEQISYRMIVDGTGSNSEGYYLYENSDVVRC